MRVEEERDDEMERKEGRVKRRRAAILFMEGEVRDGLHCTL